MDGGVNGEPAGQHAHLTTPGSQAGVGDEARTTGSAGRFAVLMLLAVDGVLCAVTTALLLPSYIGAVPFPVSALIGGLVNVAMLWAALHWTESLRLAALPLSTWLITVAAMTLGGPGDDVIFGGRGVMAYGVLVMIVLGSVPPVWLLWRRRQAAAAPPGSGREA